MPLLSPFQKLNQVQWGGPTPGWEDLEFGQDPEGPRYARTPQGVASWDPSQGSTPQPSPPTVAVGPGDRPGTQAMMDPRTAALIRDQRNIQFLEDYKAKVAEASKRQTAAEADRQQKAGLRMIADLLQKKVKPEEAASVAEMFSPGFQGPTTKRAIMQREGTQAGQQNLATFQEMLRRGRPTPEQWQVTTLADGSVARINRLTGAIEPVPGTPTKPEKPAIAKNLFEQAAGELNLFDKVTAGTATSTDYAVINKRVTELQAASAVAKAGAQADVALDKPRPPNPAALLAVEDVTGQLLDAKAIMDKYKSKYVGLYQGGVLGRAGTLFGWNADEAQQFRSEAKQFAGSIRRALLGAAQTIPELQSVIEAIPDPDKMSAPAFEAAMRGLVARSARIVDMKIRMWETAPKDYGKTLRGMIGETEATKTIPITSLPPTLQPHVLSAPPDETFIYQGQTWIRRGENLVPAP